MSQAGVALLEVRNLRVEFNTRRGTLVAIEWLGKLLGGPGVAAPPPSGAATLAANQNVAGTITSNAFAFSLTGSAWSSLNPSIAWTACMMQWVISAALGAVEEP